MKFNKIQKEIIQYIQGYRINSENKIRPSIETFCFIFKDKYSETEIRDSIDELVSSGVLNMFSFHAYLDFTKTFKSSSYNINNWS